MWARRRWEFGMIGKAVSYGFRLYTLPARVAYRRAAPYLDLPPTVEELLQHDILCLIRLTELTQVY